MCEKIKNKKQRSTRVIIVHFRGHPAPSFLGFEVQDLSGITYGQMEIPSITLREIPLQREQVRLKLLYGNKRVTTFNAVITSKQVFPLIILECFHNILYHLGFA